MRTTKEIKKKVIDLMCKIRDAENCVKGEYGNEIFVNFSEFRSAKGQLKTLLWVLGETKK